MKGIDIPAPELSRDLGAPARQGPRLLHLDGPSRGRLDQSDVPGILTGGIRWALGDAKADITPNLTAVAPGALTNPTYPAEKGK